MKKRLGLFLFMATIFGCITFNSNTLVVSAGSNEYAQPATNYASVNNDVEAFYTSTSAGSVEGLKGDALLEQLAKVLEVNHKYYNNYGELRGGLPYSDEDPENKSNIYYFYSGVSVSNTWGGGTIYNREHVWPKSNAWYNESGGGSDLHHLRPEDNRVNSTRNNLPFGEVNGGTEAKLTDGRGSNCYYGGGYFEPQDAAKGDTARIIFYLLTRYSEADSYSITKVAQSMEMLLRWHNLDPVDEWEINRNEVTFDYQGNRNPFIDHPALADAIWG